MLILRMDYTLSGVDREAAILSILAKHGLPVPTVLAGPVIDPTQPDAGVMTLLNVLPGQDLLSWFWNASAEEVEHALRLALEGVERLHLLTEPLLQEPLAQPLPHRTLHMELQELIADGGPWLHEPVFAQAVEHLLPSIASLHIPLAFSSGDYNPGNFPLVGVIAHEERVFRKGFRAVFAPLSHAYSAPGLLFKTVRVKECAGGTAAQRPSNELR